VTVAFPAERDGSQPLRVVLVSNGFPPIGHWGTEFYTHQLAVGLQARGHTVTVLCPRRDGTQPRYTLERRVEDGIEVVEVHNAGDPRKRFEDSWRNARIEQVFAELVRERQPQVVHFLHMLWGLSVRLPAVARQAGSATVATLTDYGLLCHRGQFRDWLERDCGGPTSAAECARCVREPGVWDGSPLVVAAKRAAVRTLAAVGGAGVVVTTADLELREREVAVARNQVDRWIAPTQALAAAFLARGWPKERLESLVYGIEEQAFQRPRAAEPSVLCFGFIGQFTPHKGAARIFEAVRLLQQDPQVAALPWRVELWGHAFLDRYQRYIDAQRVADVAERVHLMGAFEPRRAPEVMARFDALLVPSQWNENAPLVVLQARAAGVPIVACDVPGVREVAPPTAVLVPREDAQGLAHALRARILAGPALRESSTPCTTHAAHVTEIERVYQTARLQRT